MSLERVFIILEGIGLSRMDANVYVYLAKKGPQKGEELAGVLKFSKQEIYDTIRKLQNRGVVSASLKRTTLFSALAFDKVIDLYIKINVEQATAIKESKEELLASWRRIIKQEKA